MKKILSWLNAILISFVVINIICFAYERQAGWRNTPNGASASVRQPNSLVIHGTEGYAINRVDRNGYMNPDGELADKYILMMGASHTQGKEVPENQRYSVLVDNYFGDDDFLHVYNISSDGSYLPSQLKHFKAAMEAFPNAQLVTIEIGDTDYSIAELEKSMVQANYDSNDSALYFSHMSTMGLLKNFFKSYFPMISKIRTNISTFQNSKADASKKQIDVYEYSKTINCALEMIRSETDVPIVFIYHPPIIINNDGTISLEYSQTWGAFLDACVRNDIDVIDSGNDFLQRFDSTKEVPYGFSNTVPGTGHLNKVGHRIIATEIIEFWEELK